MKKGIFITLEGPDGVGKSTHSSWLVELLSEAGYHAVKTREPGGTDYGEALRPLFLQYALSVEAELLLLFSLRAQHVHERIKPALSSGCVVVCERFMDATYAYQSGGRGFDYDRIRLVEEAIGSFPQPDVTFFLDAPFSVLFQRLKKHDPDRFESEGEVFFEHVRQAYHRRVEEDPHRFEFIDASETLDSIRLRMFSALVERGILKKPA